MSNEFIPSSNIKLTGIAFSGILESILNFWYFGPFILGIILSQISNIIYKLKYSSKFYYNILTYFL